MNHFVPFGLVPLLVLPTDPRKKLSGWFWTCFLSQLTEIKSKCLAWLDHLSHAVIVCLEHDKTMKAAGRSLPRPEPSVFVNLQLWERSMTCISGFIRLCERVWNVHVELINATGFLQLLIFLRSLRYLCFTFFHFLSFFLPLSSSFLFHFLFFGFLAVVLVKLK